MQKDQFIEYMSNPEKLDEKSLENLREILAEYPYFQTAHLLLVKNLSRLNHMKFDSQLRISAAHVGNRQLLFRLLAQDSIPAGTAHSDDEKQETPVVAETTKQEKQVESESDVNPQGKAIADIVLEQVSEMKKDLEDKGRKDEEVVSEPVTKTNSDEIFEIDEKQEIVTDETALNQVSHAAKTASDLLVIDEPKEDVTAPESVVKKQVEQPEVKKVVKQRQKKTSVESEIHLHEVHSFSSWLSLFREDEENSAAGSKNDLIDEFIIKQPRLERKPPDVHEDDPVDMSRHSVLESDDFITETLAKIYVKQKKYDKAISFYEKLSLKYPEKVSYFADQIKEIKELLTNNS